MRSLRAFLRWFFDPSDLVSVSWLQDYARREGGSGIDQSRIDWAAMRRLNK